MIRPDIKTYHEDRRQHRMGSNIRRGNFWNRNTMDYYWTKKFPPVNIRKEGLMFVLEVAMPGFTRDEIEVEVHDDVMLIRAKKKKMEEYNSQFVLQEFDIDVMERKFYLAKGVGKEKIDAKYKNGILKLAFTDVPFAEEKEDQTVEVG